MKKTAGIWAIIAINIVYIVSTAIVTFGQLNSSTLSDPVSLVITALNALAIVLFLVSTYKLYTLKGHVLGWFNVVFAVVIVSKVLSLGVALLLYSATLGSQQILSSFSSGFILVLAIWIGSYIYLKKFLKNPQFATEQQTADAKSGAMKVVLIVAAIIVLGVGPTILYQYYYVPQRNNTLVQVVITDNLAGAMEYSISHQNSFKGYNSMLLNEAPACSSPIIVNASPDGATVSSFGKSCTAPVYYCSSLSMNAFTNTNFRPMTTVPASLVSATKYDCNDPANPLPGSSSVTVSPIQPTPGVAVFNIKYLKDIPDAATILKSFGATDCKNKWPNNPGSFMCTVPVGQEDVAVAAATSSSKIDSASRWYGGI